MDDAQCLDTDPKTGVRSSSEVASQGARALYRLREMLIRGEFTPGERMSELVLVSRLSMSRTPIRLALERLAHMGLLESNASGGFVVRGFTISEAYDAIEVRGILEGTAARLAAERLTSLVEIAPLTDLCCEMEMLQQLTVDSFPRYMDLNESLHTAILTLAKSDMLRRALEHAGSLPFASPSAMVFPTSGLPVAAEALAVAREHHRAIVESIAARQGTRAESLAREHARVGQRVLGMAVRDADAMRRVPGASLINVSGALRAEW